MFDVSGPGALDYLQYHDGQQLQRGRRPVGLHAAARLPTAGSAATSRSCASATTHFRVVTGAFDGPRDEHWFRKHLPDRRLGHVRRPHVRVRHDRRVGAERARDLVESITDEPTSPTTRVPLRHDARGAVRLHAGPPLPHLLRGRARLGDLRPDGERLGGVGRLVARPARSSASSPSAPACTAPPVGSRRATASWAPSSSSEYNPVEAGLARPKVKSADFIGKEAYLAAREEEPAAILCTLTVEDHVASRDGIDRYMTGSEPILTLDGERIVDAKGRPSVRHVGWRRAVGRQVPAAGVPPARARRRRHRARRSCT